MIARIDMPGITLQHLPKPSRRLFRPAAQQGGMTHRLPVLQGEGRGERLRIGCDGGLSHCLTDRCAA